MQKLKKQLFEFVKENKSKNLYKITDLNCEHKWMLVYENDIVFFDYFNFKANKKVKKSDLKNDWVFKISIIENSKPFNV